MRRKFWLLAITLIMTFALTGCMSPGMMRRAHSMMEHHMQHMHGDCGGHYGPGMGERDGEEGQRPERDGKRMKGHDRHHGEGRHHGRMGDCEDDGEEMNDEEMEEMDGAEMDDEMDDSEMGEMEEEMDGAEEGEDSDMAGEDAESEEADEGMEEDASEGDDAEEGIEEDTEESTDEGA